jgi:hypothetical protein
MDAIKAAERGNRTGTQGVNSRAQKTARTLRRNPYAAVTPLSGQTRLPASAGRNRVERVITVDGKTPIGMTPGSRLECAGN